MAVVIVDGVIVSVVNVCVGVVIVVVVIVGVVIVLDHAHLGRVIVGVVIRDDPHIACKLILPSPVRRNAREIETGPGLLVVCYRAATYALGGIINHPVCVTKSQQCTTKYTCVWSAKVRMKNENHLEALYYYLLLKN